MTQDEKYMKQAIKQAKKAYALDEVPIGCVIVAGDKIIARGYNRRKPTKIHSLTLSLCHPQSQQKDRRLASRGMHHVRHP